MKIAKKVLAVVLSLLMVFSLSACSGSSNELTEENVTLTVDTIMTALKEFDTDTLSAYVDSTTLSTIITYAGGYDEITTLANAMFENLDYSVVDIDLTDSENATVTLSVINKDMGDEAKEYIDNLLDQYSTIQLLAKLATANWLNTQVEALVMRIDECEMQEDYTEITLTITQGEDNLVLAFDETAEDAVSGGVLSAVSALFG